MGRHLEMAIGALNGVVGDCLERTGNGLATPMHVVRVTITSARRTTLLYTC